MEFKTWEDLNILERCFDVYLSSASKYNDPRYLRARELHNKVREAIMQLPID